MIQTGVINPSCQQQPLQFQHVFIYPAKAQLWLQLSGQFVSLDGTLCKVHYIQTLLLALLINTNRHIHQQKGGLREIQ